MGTYSREEAEQVPNQWWDVWDLFPNVSEREIENPYDHNWARRPEQIEANYNEDGTFKEVLRLNLAGFPIPRFTRENELYYYTRKDQNTGEIIPVTQSTSQNRPWYKGLPYPLPGSEKQNDLSDYAFASWFFNQAPAQVAPLAALGKGIPQIRTQRRTSPPGFYREGSVNVNLKNVEKDVTNILSLSRFKNTRPKGIIPSVVTGKVTKDDPIALGVQEFDQGTIPGADRKPYAYKAVYNYNPSHIVNESRLSSLRNQRLFKNLNTEEQDTILGLINPIDEYTIRTENSNSTPRGNPFNPSKPSSGYIGQRKLITSDGNELGIRWSVKEGGWKLYNRSVNLQVVDKRNVWNQPSSLNKAGEARVILETKSEANRMAKRLLDRLKDSDSAEDRDLHARIVGGQNPFQVEHIHNQDSGVWIERTPGVFTHAYKRNSEGNFIQPGDPENYRIVGIYDFKYLKDSIEVYMKANGLSKQYHLEMDSSNNLYVKHGNRDEDVLSRSGARVIIHRSLDADKGVEAFNAIINGAEQKDLPTSLAHDYRRTFADWMQDPEGGLSEDDRLADKGYSGPEQRMLNLQAQIEKEQRKLLMTTSEGRKDKIRTKLADLYNEGLEYMNQDAMDPSVKGGFNWLYRAFTDRL